MPDQTLQTVQITNPTVTSIDKMVDEVASFIGGSENPQVKTMALNALDRAANRLNMAGLYLFRRKEVTYSTSAAGGSGDTLLEDGDQTVPFPSDWGWPERGVRIIDSNGDLLREILWIPWEDFSVIKTRDTTNASGVPNYISIRNEMEALLNFWRPVDTSKVAQITVPYFARIQRPSEVSDSNLLATKETVEALITGGEAFIMRFRHKNQPGMWRPFMDDFQQTITKAKGAASRNQQVFDTWAHLGEVGYEGDNSGFFSSGYLVINLGN